MDIGDVPAGPAPATVRRVLGAAGSVGRRRRFTSAAAAACAWVAAATVVVVCGVMLVQLLFGDRVAGDVWLGRRPPAAGTAPSDDRVDRDTAAVAVTGTTDIAVSETSDVGPTGTAPAQGSAPTDQESHRDPSEADERRSGPSTGSTVAVVDNSGPGSASSGHGSSGPYDSSAPDDDSSAPDDDEPDHSG